MTALAYYLLKVILCSGILFLYYALALKNKAFHQWNRFYLLSAVVLSLVLPLVKFTVFNKVAETHDAIKILYAVQSADDYLETITVTSRPGYLSPEQWYMMGYAFVSLLLFLLFMTALLRIRLLLKAHAVQRVAGICFLNTRDPRTPFSFLHYIFWNEAIPLHSETGRQIFKHEAVHVKEGHTWDKLFLQIVLVLFWCNPFFWAIRRELRFIHEFIADQKAIGKGGTAAFAAMILQAAYPQQFHAIVNPFFQKSIKRRLLMLTKIHTPRLAYISRLTTLLLISIVVFAFTVRTKTHPPPVAKLHKEFVVVIDAGHGYKDDKPSGVQFEGVSEDDIVLQLAGKIRALNKNESIRLVLTRSDQGIVELKDRVAVAKACKADLFISLHLSAAQNNKDDGFDVYLASANKATAEQSLVFASTVLSSLSDVYKTNTTVRQSKNSIYVLDQNTCPAVLIECGFLSNQNDRSFVSNAQNQEKIAVQLLHAIETYANNRATGYVPSAIKDTVPAKKKEIVSMDVNKAKKVLTVYYADGSCETMTEEEADKRGLVRNGGYGNVQQPPLPMSNAKVEFQLKGPIIDKPLLIVDGNEVAYDLLTTIDQNKIESINILKDASAVAKYGERGRNGVIEVQTKPTKNTDRIILRADSMTMTLDSFSVRLKPDGFHGSATIRDVKDAGRTPIFEKSEIEASVKTIEWRTFLAERLTLIVNELSKTAPAGIYTVNIRFIVDKDGSLSDFKAVDDPGHGIAEKVVNIMQYSPKWIPAEQNGKSVKSYHTQPIRLVVSKN